MIHTCPTCGNDAINGTRWTCGNGHTWTTRDWTAAQMTSPDSPKRADAPRRCHSCGGFMGGELGTVCGRCVLAKNTHENRARGLAAKEA